MKKNITIGIAIVVVLIAAIGAISFAAWDKTSDSIIIGTINTPDNVELGVTTTDATNKKNLVPSGAVKTANEAYIVSLGNFSLALSSQGGSTLEQLKEKVKINWSSIDITSDAITNVTTYVEALVLVEDINGTIVIDNNDTKKYTAIATDGELSVGPTYILAMQFKSSYNQANATDVDLIKGRQIKAVVNFNCVAR